MSSSRAQKILVFGSGAGLGGAQTAFRELLGFLLSEGHTVGAIAVADSDDGVPRLRNLALHHRVPASRASLRGLARKIRAMMIARNAACSFFPDVFISVGLSQTGSFLARQLGYACFSVCQDFIAGRSSTDTALTKALNSFNALVLQSPSMVQNLASQGIPESRLSWLPCFPNRPEAGFSRSALGACRIAYFGRLAANKGVDVLLQAIKNAEFGNSIQLDIWGDGPERAKLAAQVTALELQKAIFLKGPYPGGMKGAALMCGYHALVVPSQGCEGLPLIMLEAMAYGIPVLATDVGAIGDCCLDNLDFVVVGPTCPELTHGLEDLVGKIEANWFQSDRLKAYYERHFSYDAMAQRWRKFLLAPRGFFDPTH